MQPKAPPEFPIRLIGVRQNNLKNISVEFPARKLTVITGLSGSGKSSLAFDTLYAEGQRRYIESLSTYTRQFLEKMPKPDLDRVENIPPAIALEQKNSVMGSRSTIGTQTEVSDYLRVLFARAGRVYCPNCKTEVKPSNSDTIIEWAIKWLPERKGAITAPTAFSFVPLASGNTSHKKTTSASKKTQLKGQAKSRSKTDPSKAATSLSLESWLQIVREQGYTRVMYRHGTLYEILDIEELQAELQTKQKDNPQPQASPTFDAIRRAKKDKSLIVGTFEVVIDRLKISGELDESTRGRVRDSIEQALKIGERNVRFTDLGTNEVHSFDDRFACSTCKKEFQEPQPLLFSFNSPMGACSHCNGFGFTLELDEALVVPDPSKTLRAGAIDPFSKPSFSEWQDDLFRFAEKNGIAITKRYRELTPTQKRLLWDGPPETDKPARKLFSGISACFEELKKWKYKIHIRVFIRRYQTQITCTECQGARIKPEALYVKVGGLNFSEAHELPITETLTWLNQLDLNVREQQIAKDILYQVRRRFAFLDEVGVGYLTLSRPTKTLSGGEFQRINLATQLGNGLCGTLYVLDEPSIGLHAKDTERLIRVLERLRNQGNTVVVVEHDLQVMRAADWVVEIGPNAGRKGGEIVAAGPATLIERHPDSLTGGYLSGQIPTHKPRTLRGDFKRSLTLKGCRENNLKNIDVEFPLDRFVVVTGVSGSGKSTLVHKTLYRALSKIFDQSTEPPGVFNQLYGAEQLSGVVLLDQSPIGRNSRSNPATYLKAWDEVRRIYANQTLSLKRGYMAQHFSFNVDGGRCPVCKGEGEVSYDLHFMAEVKLPCEECNGERFKKAVLDVTYRKKNISQLLHTTIDEAYEMFIDNSVLRKKLAVLREVGLGYLQLGQSATTLSGGESQRLKIASTLDDKLGQNLLYIFDEPTTGLHIEDIKRLMDVIHDLVDSRQSVIMIEHHLDVIATADWVIDLGPDGGKKGGEIIAQGSPTRLIEIENSITGQMLKKEFGQAAFTQPS